ncbi:hypothetical protein M9H77_03374 [Catharanthus roseus]|uniref:Uncharacterized protein n=1 Tax=Catharanthus roseus TaxID=4058 RepID=A0ACC0CB33_CATRO|nr:hypothetical protein M9H77_03374 [Catharanthus roseus]
MPGRLSWLTAQFFLKSSQILASACSLVFVNVTEVITRVTLPNSGIRARLKFDLSGVWCLLHSSYDADVIQNLLGYFPDSQELLSSLNLYGRDKLTLSAVKNSLKSKDLDLQKENKTNGENLFVRGRVDRREPSSHCSKSKARSRDKNKSSSFVLWQKSDVRFFTSLIRFCLFVLQEDGKIRCFDANMLERIPIKFKRKANNVKLS